MKKNTINNITKLSSRMPKTLNEALNFNDNQSFEGEDMNIGEDKPQAPELGDGMETTDMITGVNPASEKAKKLIDDIRKMSLRAMAELADTPEDENYIMLKKVWSMTDRKPEQDKNNA